MKLMLENPNLELYFRKIECSDESYFGTIFNHVNKRLTLCGTTYVKWEGTGRPKNLQAQALIQEGQVGHFLFARKFNSRDRELFENL